MHATAHDSARRIEVSTYMPRALRIAVAVVGAGACILVIAELGRALWPPSFLTLFFGIIVVGGLNVGLSFVAAAFLAPNVRWAFTPGSLTIETELSGRTDVHTFARNAFSAVTVREVSEDSGPNSFRLDCTLADPARARVLFPQTRPALAVFSFLWAPWRSVGKTPDLLKTLASPSFPTRAEAEAALAMLER